MASLPQPTAATKIQISLNIIDDPISPKLVINITDDTRHKIEIAIARNEKADFFGYVNFLIDGFRISTSPGLGQDFNNDILFAMIEKYKDFIGDLFKTELVNDQVNKERLDLSFTQSNNPETEILTNFYKDFSHSQINVYTIDHSNDHVIARTKVEFDADVIPIISADFWQTKDNPFFMSLLRIHNCNVFCANLLFSYRAKKFQFVVNRIGKMIRIVSTSVPLYGYLYPFLVQNVTLSNLNIQEPLTLYFIFAPIISAALWRYSRRLMLRYAPNMVARYAPRIIAYLIKIRLLSNFRSI
jgi:hypothetical protein